MITVDTISKSYGSRRAVDALSFTVADGRITGFVGPNGSGKSTTMRMMVGLTRPDGGEVRFGRSRYRNLADPARTVGAALGAAAHPSRTARHHLAAMAAAAGLPSTRATDVLAEVGLSSAADERVGGFSLGMGQRLALAGAILGRPETLILDEPANGLDPDGIRWLRRFLRDYADAGGSVLVSSHLITELAAVADDIVVIGAGRLLAAGPIDSLTDQEQATVLVESPEAIRLADLVTSLGAATAGGVEVADDGRRLTVTGTTRTAVAQVAVDHHIRVDELTEHRRSLEDIVVDLTTDAAEFAAA